MRRRPLFAALLMCVAPCCAQLPAGTRDFDDHARERAANASNARLADAETALEKNDFATATNLLKALAVERPKDAQIAFDLGFAYEHTGAEEAASGAYAAAIADDPGYAPPVMALSLMDARAGRMDKAHAGFARVAHMDGAATDLRARALRALAKLDAQDRPVDASDELLQAIKLNGEQNGDAALIAQLAAKTGDTVSAEAEFRRALTVHPGDIEAAAGLAQVLVRSKRYAEAEQVLASPLAANPDDPRLNSEMAAALASEGKVKEAIPLLVKLHDMPAFAGTPEVTRQLARLYALDGQNGQAEVLYKSALAQEPQNAPLMDDLGSILVREQKYAEAQQVLTQAVALRDRFATKEDFGEAAGHLAFAASKNGQPEMCLRALALRATVLPNSGPTLFLEATAHDTLHQYKEAQRAYRAFLAIAGGQFPDQEFQARHRLVVLEHMK